MSIFQKSVINNHLSQLDQDQVDKAFEKFNENYSFSKITEIQKMKEEEYQDGFLRDIFVDVFGYTLKPADNYNLAREYKNQTDGKKADGAILKNDKAIAVIELKSTKTKDLINVTQQAFNYKNNQPECKYVITSNFQKLRFYIDYSNEYEEFDLFNLPKDNFQLLYLLLQKDSILTDLPLKLKTETKFHEENISDKLYKDYSSFKYKIYNNLVKNNPQYDRLTLFKKSQKFLDRLLFVFFAEDTGLVPPNAISKIVEQWQLFIDNDEYFSLYSRFVKFFIHLDKGHKYKTYDLPAYNGGLFAPDEILDNITIDDDVLKNDALLLSSYDYSTEVDVNILGHIFEHSLNEIEEITAEIEGTATDKNKTKRKKDGVFYTPKYITQYIIENTIGKLCIEKREKLGILEIEFDESVKTKNGKISAVGKKLFETLQAYKDWLFSLKIVDPACGSGAFLNQALNFLINEHQQIDDIIAELTGEKLRLFDTDKTILEKNLYGVDINDESVEIAKLSLWLRTAQKGRKLSKLNNNIKCGNSLIDDPEVAGEKAFNWQNEFPEIFANGGFDVVIGNPPYVKLQGLKTNYEKESFFYEKNYKSATSNYDIYVLFIEKSLEIINKTGKVSFILPHKFLISEFGKGIRGLLVKEQAVESILHFGSEMVFADASTYTCIITLSHKNSILQFKQIIPDKISEFFLFDEINVDELSTEQWILTNQKSASVLKKIKDVDYTLKDVFSRFVQGIITGKDAVYCVKGIIKGNYLEITDEEGNIHFIEREIVKPHLRGEDISKYQNLVNKEWLIFPYKLENDKAILFTKEEMEGKYSNTLKYLENYEDILRARERNKFDTESWYQYSRNQAISVMEQMKIITPEICYGGNMTIDENNFYHNSKCHTLLISDDTNYFPKSILPILNSKIFWFFASNTGNVLRGGYIGVKRKLLETFPIPKAPKYQQPFIEKTDQMLSLNKELQVKTIRFINRVKANFEIEKLSTKIEKFYDYDFKTFVSELKKQKVNLSLTKQDEWEEYFNSYKSEINLLQSEIELTDKEIDQMVYQLYGLTDEEIAIVENSIK